MIATRIMKISLIINLWNNSSNNNNNNIIYSNNYKLEKSSENILNIQNKF